MTEMSTEPIQLLEKKKTTSNCFYSLKKKKKKKNENCYIPETSLFYFIIIHLSFITILRVIYQYY